MGTTSFPYDFPFYSAITVLSIPELQKLCDGLGITLREFFNDDLFDNIEQEIKQTAAAPDSFRFRRCCFVRMEITIQTRLLRSLRRTIAIPRITYSTQGMATLFGFAPPTKKKANRVSSWRCRKYVLTRILSSDRIFMVPSGTGRCQFRLWCDCHRQSEDSDSLRDAPR